MENTDKKRADYLERQMLSLAGLFERTTESDNEFLDGYARAIKLMSEAIESRIENVYEVYPKE